MNYYPFHIGDYLSATRHLSWEEDAAYRRLLDTCYMTEKPLPLDERAVCRLVLATTDAQRDAVHVVLAEFFVQTPEGWVNRRAGAEIEVMREKQHKQRERANKRWHQPGGMGGRDGHEGHEGHGLLREGDLFGDGLPPPMPWEGAADAAACETDAAASKSDAVAMPPTPTPAPGPTPAPTPDPSPGGEGEGAAAGADAPTAGRTTGRTGATKPGRRSASTSSTAERPAEVPEPVWQDFGRLRREKRAPLTDTALAGFRREAARAGISLTQALTHCCVAGWQGFRADWYANYMGGGSAGLGGRSPRPPVVNRQEALEQRNRAVADAWVPPELRRAQTQRQQQQPAQAQHEGVH